MHLPFRGLVQFGHTVRMTYLGGRNWRKAAESVGQWGRSWWGRQDRSTRIVVIAAPAAVLVAIAASLNSGPADPGPQRPQPAVEVEVSRGTATVICERAVADRLRSPSTAEFGRPSVTVTSSGARVTGHVDAENGFGATVRADYLCVVEGVGDNLRVVDVAVTDR